MFGPFWGLLLLFKRKGLTFFSRNKMKFPRCQHSFNALLGSLVVTGLHIKKER